MLFLVGLGGAGSKIVEGFYRKNIGGLIGRLASREEQEVKGVAIDTSEALSGLSAIPSAHRVLIGMSHTKGHGTGGDVALGRRILVEESEFAVSALAKAGFGGAEEIFLLTGLGGGTGTGGFPVLAREIKKAFNLPVFGIVTLPSRSEGTLYSKNAQENFLSIRSSVDGLIVIDNSGPAARGEVAREAYKKINAAVKDFLKGFHIPTLIGALRGDIATIALAQLKPENTTLKDLLIRLIRNNAYFTIKSFNYVYAVLRGDGGKIYGERFAQEWIKTKYNAGLRYTVMGPDNSKQLNIYTLITGITGLRERLAVEAKTKKVSSELENLLKDIKSL